MSTDIWLTVANVTCGVVLGFIGIEMVNNPPGDVGWKKWLYRSLFVFFGTAVIIITVAQSTRNANEQQRLQREANAVETSLSNQLSSANGKLDAISRFMGQISSQPIGSSDAAVKAYEVMARAVMKMAQNTKVPTPLSRELSPIDQKTLENNLRELQNPMAGLGTVRISSVLGDEEAFRFAQQLAKIFLVAGWRVIDGKASRFSPPVNANSLPTGITVDSGGGDGSDYHAYTIRNAFSSIGIKAGSVKFDEIGGDVNSVQLKIWSHD
jgi:hypothetical protein